MRTRKLGISTRRIKNLKKAVREHRDGAVVHGNSGRHPANVINEAILAKITALKKAKRIRGLSLHAFSEITEGVRTDKPNRGARFPA